VPACIDRGLLGEYARPVVERDSHRRGRGVEGQ